MIPNSSVIKRRCAIYTRKSHEEGLELEFNSLHAQRDAALAYIASQKSEGWIALPDHYDDGGVSGASLNRPALTRLLRDIEAGLVDIVVTYKLDRLSRSLTDFAKLMDLFERHDVTCVSITQQFSTTSSMGRLTLNVLLSFAQFERELSAERIRDKFLQSRKRGLWMGGWPPLGYEVQDRRLVVVEPEAAIVRRIFDRFAKAGSALTVLLAEFATVWNELFPAEQARIVQLLVERVDVQEDALEVRISAEGLASLVGELRQDGERNAA